MSVSEAFDRGDPIDRAMVRAFYSAVRLHRLHGVPLILWEDERVREVDPFTIQLPEEDAVARPDPSADSRVPGSES